jgi:hypothetical protein
MHNAYAHISTVGGASLTQVAQKFGGFALNGSAGASTLSIYDGTTLVISTSAAANAVIIINLAVPVAFRTSLLATCSGTGHYSVFVAS